MTTPPPHTPATPMGRARPELRDVITDALRYWEVRRLAYNAVLVATVLAATVGRWGALLSVHALGLGVFYAIMANVCFCAAYVPDVFVQLSDFGAAWRRWRFLLFAAGLAVAVPMALFSASTLVP